MNNPPDVALILAYIHGELSPEQIQEIEARLISDPTFAKQLMFVSLDEVALADWADVDSQVARIDSVNQLLHPTASAAPEVRAPSMEPLSDPFNMPPVAAFPLGSGAAEPSGTSAPTRWAYLPWSGFFSWLIIGCGFTLSLALGLWYWSSSKTQVIAYFHNLDRAEWKHTSRALAIGSEILPGQDFELLSGHVDIACSQGANLRIVGPAKWKMVDLMTSRLESGQLTAHVPHEAIGYTVQTPVVSVLDKGTRFGIKVSPKLGAEVHVFEGEVETQITNKNGTAKDPQSILMTQAVRYDTDGKLQAWIPPAYDTFESVNLVPGIVRTSQNIRWTSSPPASLEHARVTSDDNMLLLLERKDVTLPGPIAATFKQPIGGTRSAYDRNVAMLPEGLRVNSYLLHYNSAGRKKAVQGEVQFDRPILAVIARGDQLIWSDHLLGRQDIAYEGDKSIRGLKGTTPGTPAPDVLNMSKPNTVSIYCEAGRNTVAELRILVAADDSLDGDTTNDRRGIGKPQ